MNRFSLLVLGLLFIVASACQPSTKKDKTPPPDAKEPITESPTAPEPQTESTETTGSNEPIAEVPEPLPEPPTPPQVVSSASIVLPCASPDFNMNTAVNRAAKLLSGTPYSQANKTDCSGMYHKLLDQLRKDCPEGEMPTIDKARSTRGLAAWYHKKGQFQIVHDPSAMEKLIQPGTVMFYGYGKRLGKYNASNLIMDSLTTRYVGINHVSIVTSVKRENGKVVSYEMFHGRTPGKPAGITSSQRVYDRHPELPMYGNWKETWVGVVKAPMLPKTDGGDELTMR